MNPSDHLRYTPMPVGEIRPEPSPLGRRDIIRDSLEHGDWTLAAQHLHEAHSTHEWLSCGLSSWTEYVTTIPISRSYDWKLRHIHRCGCSQAGITYRAALRLTTTHPLSG